MSAAEAKWATRAAAAVAELFDGSPVLHPFVENYAARTERLLLEEGHGSVSFDQLVHWQRYRLGCGMSVDVEQIREGVRR